MDVTIHRGCWAKYNHGLKGEKVNVGSVHEVGSTLLHDARWFINSSNVIKRHSAIAHVELPHPQENERHNAREKGVESAKYAQNSPPNHACTSEFTTKPRLHVPTSEPTLPRLICSRLRFERGRTTSSSSKSELPYASREY
jgi:hypothetical protein